MATKFYNNQSEVFHRLLKGENFEELLKSEIDRINNIIYLCSQEESERLKKMSIDKVIEVKKFFDKITFFEKPEVFKINSWGFEQTNYENLKVLGQVGGSIVCIVNNDFSDVYTIQKKKYVEKTCTYIDNHKVRGTSWQKPYSREELREQAIYNMYNGY